MILAAFCTESLGKQQSGSLVMISLTFMSRLLDDWQADKAGSK
jgi:hypothetical protein